MTEYYTQCELHRQINSTTYRIHVAWIPEKYAKVGKIIKLEIDGKWVDGWKVVFIGARAPKKSVEIASRDYKHQREESDI